MYKYKLKAVYIQSRAENRTSGFRRFRKLSGYKNIRFSNDVWKQDVYVRFLDIRFTSLDRFIYFKNI